MERASELASWRIRASGRVDRSSSSTSMSSEDIEELEPAEDLRRRFVGLEECAHSGTGFKTSNCRRNLLVYSLPLTTSSASLTRSFRRREFPASDIAKRSSSLSSQAGVSPFSPSSKLGRCIRALSGTVEGPASRKNNLRKVS